APTRRAAAARELPADLVRGVHAEAEAAVAVGIADANEAGGDQAVDGLARDLAELLRSRGALSQHGGERRRAREQLGLHLAGSRPKSSAACAARAASSACSEESR